MKFRRFQSKRSVKRDRDDVIEIALWLIAENERLTAELNDKPQGDVLAIVG